MRISATFLPAALLLAGYLAGCGRSPLHDGPIVLITFEALRADACASLGGPPGLMPQLELLARESSWVGRGVAPSSESAPALGTLLTGLQPWQHQALHAGRPGLAPDLQTLAEALHERGYTTGGFPADPWTQPFFGHGQGFDAFARLGHGRRALDRLANLGSGRHFVWVHLNAAWADGRLGELLGALRASGQWDRTLLVATALHGEAAGEQGLALPGGGGLERAGLEVPLLVKLPKGTALRLRPPAIQRVATARIWATLVEAAGGEPPPATAPSLWRDAPAEVLSELYQTKGTNRFSLLVSDPAGDLQIRQVSRFAPAEPEPQAIRAFGSTPAFTGAGGPEGQSWTLERWLPGGGTVQVADAGRTAEMAGRLAAAWRRFVPDERSPDGESAAWNGPGKNRGRWHKGGKPAPAKAG